MEIYCFYSISQTLISENNMFNALHLIIFNQFCKNIEDAYLKTSKDF